MGVMIAYGFTDYFENEVLRKRPYLKKEWCTQVCEKPLKVEPQEHNRFRFWGEIDALGGQILRVITPEDKSWTTTPTGISSASTLTMRAAKST